MAVTIGAGCPADAQLLWDTVWDPAAGLGDWALAGPAEANNRGGLRATAAIETAVVLCLFTDRRCPPDHPLAGNIQDGNPRGYFGDGVDVRADLGERPMGSLLWLLENTALDPLDTPRWLQSLALDALSVLTACGAVARIDAQAGLDPSPSRAWLAVQLYGRDGAKVYDRRFASLWQQIR